MTPRDRPVTLAAIIGAHGVTGEVRLKVFTDDLGGYGEMQLDGRSVRLTALRASGAGMIARIAGVADRSAADALRGQTLTVPRAALPPLDEGEYYHGDLIGLAVVDESGAAIGHVVAVDNFGASDVIEIERPTGKRFMVPMRAEAVPEWDAERLVVAAAFVGE